MKCSKCGNFGHNLKSCGVVKVPKTRKRKVTVQTELNLVDEAESEGPVTQSEAAANVLMSEAANVLMSEAAAAQNEPEPIQNESPAAQNEPEPVQNKPTENCYVPDPVQDEPTEVHKDVLYDENLWKHVAENDQLWAMDSQTFLQEQASRQSQVQEKHTKKKMETKKQKETKKADKPE